VQISRPANAGFQHPAGPDRDIIRSANIVHGNGLGQTADPTDFDVDDPAGVDFDSQPGIPFGVDAFIQADRGFELGLEFGMVNDVVVALGLLDHEQVEIIHFLK
jgi:hypothetical protein